MLYVSILVELLRSRPGAAALAAALLQGLLWYTSAKERLSNTRRAAWTSSGATPSAYA